MTTQIPLKEATAAKHKIAERMPFNIRMFKGEMTKYDYCLYLTQQLEIFSTIERIGIPHSSLSRSEAITSDIMELNQQGIVSCKVLPKTIAYKDYLQSLSPANLLPHVYLNYLAIMFGGQMIKKMVPSSGKMYDFENMQEALQAVRSLQTDSWAEEANRGFDFTIAIFEDLEANSKF